MADRAVNPVIGTILLVAIVIILSSAISVFVFGLGQDLTEPAQASVDLETTNAGNGTATVTAQSLLRADHVTVTAETTDGSANLYDPDADTTTDELEAILESAGERASFESARDDPVEVRIVAVAVAGQGETIVLDETIEL